MCRALSTWLENTVPTSVINKEKCNGCFRSVGGGCWRFGLCVSGQTQGLVPEQGVVMGKSPFYIPIFIEGIPPFIGGRPIDIKEIGV